MVRCALCDWGAPAWSSTADGKPRSGYVNLQNHMSISHHEHFNRVQRLLRKLDQDRASLLYALSR